MVEEAEPTTFTTGEDASGIGGLRGPMMLTTPGEDQWHMIHDDHLTIISRRGKDSSFDYCLALAGAGLGFFQNLIAIGAALWNNVAASRTDVILALICVVCLAGAIAKFTEHRSKKTDLDTVIARVRSGKKVKVI